MRTLDSKATKIARARHMAGVETLQALFGWDATEAHQMILAKRASRKRDRRQRRKQGKAQRIARRRNRPNG